MTEQPFTQFSLSASYACYSLTSSYSLSASYLPYAYTPTPAPEQKDKGVREFFESLGYEVECESKGYFEFWYNISNSEGLVVQIDQGVPLEDIIMDICEFYNGKPGVSKSDYKISGPDTPEVRKLFKKVHDFKVYGLMPTDHLTYEI